MTTTEQALDGARRVARRAAQLKTGLQSCPYPADGTPRQRACRQAWVRTYLRMRPGEAAEVDYGDDLTALAEGPDSTTTAGDDQAGTPASVAAAVAQGTIVSRGGGR